jgi:thiol-disulfide isomerase/thioredoxin
MLDERKLIGGWVLALAILAGVVYAAMRAYDASKQAERPAGGPTAPGSDDDDKFGPDLGAKIPALAGDWLSQDGNAPVLSGKVTLVDVWGTFCGPCIAAIPSNNKLVAEYGPKGLAFVGLSAEPRDTLAAFRKKVQMDYPALAVPDELVEKLNVKFFPTTLLYDKQGALVWKGIALERGGKLLPDFAEALSKALAEAGPAKVENVVELPAEFAKLVEKSNAAIGKPGEEIGPKIGEALPPLKGTWLTADGKNPDLSGKIQLIDCWTTVCGTCVESIPHNAAFAQKYAAQGLLFVGATPEAPELVAEFKKHIPIGYPVLSECGAFFRATYVEALPFAFLVGKDGKLVWQGSAFQTGDTLEPDFEKALNAALAVTK